MKLSKTILTLGSVAFLSLIVLSIFGTSLQANAATCNNQTVSKIIDAISLQAKHKIETGMNAEVNTDTQQIIYDADTAKNKLNKSANKTYPSNFDLRHCDIFNQGVEKNYITSVKQQGLFGTCWAFATTAASETSILSKLNQDSATTDENGNKRDSLDLSEHHTAWFNYTPLTEEENKAQATEGAYSLAEEEAMANPENEFSISQRLNTGGVGLSATSTYANGIGPVKEPNEKDPSLTPLQKQLLYKGRNELALFDNNNVPAFYADKDDWSIDNSLRYQSDYKLLGGVILPDVATFDKNGKYSVEHADYVTGLMKEQLLQGRAMTISFCADSYDPSFSKEAPEYINTENNTWAHYTSKKTNGNHAVTVVGWDDDYSTDNFLSRIPILDENGNITTDENGNSYKETPKPPKNGAWIVKNSWGAKNSIGQGLNTYFGWGVDGEGYFYLSYYDLSLAEEEAFDFEVDAEKNANKPSIINNHDNMPCESARAIEQKEPVEAINVFRATQDQQIAEVSTVTSRENESVTYNIYKIDYDKSLENAELIKTFDVKYDFKGFHREILPETITINKGQSFAIGVIQTDENGCLLGISADYNRLGYKYEQAPKGGDKYYCKGIVNPGESFMRTVSDNSLTDWSDIKKVLENSERESALLSYDNFPIKAFSYPAKLLGTNKKEIKDSEDSEIAIGDDKKNNDESLSTANDVNTTDNTTVNNIATAEANDTEQAAIVNTDATSTTDAAEANITETSDSFTDPRFLAIIISIIASFVGTFACIVSSNSISKKRKNTNHKKEDK